MTNNTIKINILQEEEIKNFPKQAYDTDAGYDVICAKEPKIVGAPCSYKEGYYYNIDFIQYHTKIHLELNAQTRENQIVFFHSNLRSRSSVRKYNLVLANGVGLADPAYKGEYLFCFKYIFQPEDLLIDNNKIIGKINTDKIYKIGDAIGQLEFQPTYFADFRFIQKLKETSRGEKGFGSSDKKA